jgi:hypothetical protein
MFADEALRCECGYEVREFDEAARVDEVRQHASETHGIHLSADVALDVVRRVRLVPSRGSRGPEGVSEPTPRSGVAPDENGLAGTHRNCRTRDTGCVKRHIDGGLGWTDPAAITSHRRSFR